MSNETIFREVDEELRGERLREFWRRFGPFVIAAAVLVVLAVAVNEGWKWWQNSNSARSSDQFYAAVDAAETGDMAAAQTALQQVEAQGSGGYPVLARFRAAALLAEQGDTGGAVAAYDALATGQNNAQLRDLALVFAATLLVDGGDVAAVQQRVGGLAVEGHPMRNAAREAIGLAQYRAGELNAALETFADIAADPQTSSDMQQRVQVYSAQLVAMGAQSAEQQATAAGAPSAPSAPPQTGEAPAQPRPEAPMPLPALQMQPAPQGAQSAVTMQAPQVGAQPVPEVTETAVEPTPEAAPVAPAEGVPTAGGVTGGMVVPSNAQTAVPMQAPTAQ